MSLCNQDRLLYRSQMGAVRQAGDKGPNDDKPSDPSSDALKLFTQSRWERIVGRCVLGEGLLGRTCVECHCDDDAKNEMEGRPAGDKARMGDSAWPWRVRTGSCASPLQGHREVWGTRRRVQNIENVRDRPLGACVSAARNGLQIVRVPKRPGCRASLWGRCITVGDSVPCVFVQENREFYFVMVCH